MPELRDINFTSYQIHYSNSSSLLGDKIRTLIDNKIMISGGIGVI